MEQASILVSRKAHAQAIVRKLRNANISAGIANSKRGEHEVFMFIPPGWGHKKADNLLRDTYRITA